MNARAPDLQTRRAMRQHGRALLKSPHDVSAHLARLHAALRLLDAEPVQGILADLFVALPQTETVMRQAALQMAGERLPAHVADSFRRHSEAGSLPTITPLATRWSLIARPSADVSARVRRVNPDHSRSLAMEVAEALRIGRTAEAIRIETAFLDHCENCQDKLAFMLAARELRRHRVAMDERWTRTSTLLEQRDMMGHLQPSPDSTSADTK